jgi:hypothetical protein
MPTKSDGRLKTGLAASVEEALKAVDTYGRRHAARLMSMEGVPFAVVVRVLAEPSRRRSASAALPHTAYHDMQDTCANVSAPKLS